MAPITVLNGASRPAIQSEVRSLHLIGKASFSGHSSRPGAMWRYSYRDSYKNVSPALRH